MKKKEVTMVAMEVVDLVVMTVVVNAAAVADTANMA